MSRYIFDGTMAAWFVPTIANTAAPTAAEINAGVNITSFLLEDGFDPGISDTQASTSSVSSRTDTEIQGTYNIKPKIKAYRDDTTDTAWTTLSYLTVGFIVIRPIGGPTAVAATGNKVEVYPVQLGKPSLNASAENATKSFTTTCALTAPENLSATVA